ncbi:MAG: recombinase family protein, partial [Dietzia cercidiphylli]
RQKAERGDWHGAAKFGYGTGGVLIPEQAAVVREMADRFLAGQSLRSITAWLNDESGFPAPQAKTGKTSRSVPMSSGRGEEVPAGCRRRLRARPRR